MRIVMGIMLIVVVVGLLAVLGYYIAGDIQNFTEGGDSCDEHSPQCAKFLANIKTSYDEGKDLSKSFLTLIVAVFVGSITFSEKIIDFKTASTWAKVAMIICWFSLLLAIVACGIGMVYLAAVLAQSLFANSGDYHHMLKATVLIGISGLLFVLGLLMMLLAGMPTFTKKPALNSEV